MPHRSCGKALRQFLHRFVHVAGTEAEADGAERTMVPAERREMSRSICTWSSSRVASIAMIFARFVWLVSASSTGSNPTMRPWRCHRSGIATVAQSSKTSSEGVQRRADTWSVHEDQHLLRPAHRGLVHDH